MNRIYFRKLLIKKNLRKPQSHETPKPQIHFRWPTAPSDELGRTQNDEEMSNTSIYWSIILLRVATPSISKARTTTSSITDVILVLVKINRWRSTATSCISDTNYVNSSQPPLLTKFILT